MAGGQNSAEVLANLFGISVRQVQVLASEGVIPKADKGVYNVPACVRDYVQHVKAKALITNADGVAEFFDLTPAAIYKMAKEGMPRSKRGKYNLGECTRWYLDKWRAKVEGGEALDIHEERKALIIEQRRRAKLEADKMERTQIPVTEVADDFMAMAGAFVSHLNALPGRHANELASAEDPAEVRQLLLAECRAIRSEIAKQVRKYAEGFSVADKPDRRRPARKKPGRVGKRK